ncbi:glycosyltransferase [Mycobacterium sp. SMC-2]|uniref:glycosyltransferase n=1 Tax=Mycobacterium sp. SMC-2 TaxID=2857058 RepID=UPI0021B1A38B|nr:glycosyltransferase [Mycobacterium sp. SMC-2]UXA07486.1 glycosyltransferase [Mycobacterium sp. SMC-2]
MPDAAPIACDLAEDAAMTSEVALVPRSMDRWRDVLSVERWDALGKTIRVARSICAGRTVWCVNSTAAGGGVSEMLRTMLSYLAGIGLDARWAVVDGDTEFFRITKRLHNFVHGNAGDGGVLDRRERDAYHRTMRANAAALTSMVAPGSLVVLHDPQSAGLVEPLQRHGCAVVWRCHIGAELVNDHTKRAWEFIEPFVFRADRLVFSRAVYVPEQLAGRPVSIVSPSIDPFAAKNQWLDENSVRAILSTAGLLDAGQTAAQPLFCRLNGDTAKVEGRVMLLGGDPPEPCRPLALQVSRWDRLKDHLGVMRGFVRRCLPDTDADLMLVGPHVDTVADDPESVNVFSELVREHAALPEAQRARVHIVSLPMTDVEENAAIVNALQRHATIVVQKSLEEGFGLTVTEALWKGKPVLASAVGGIRDQIRDGRTGLLLDDPTDLDAFGDALAGLLADPARRHELGAAAARDAHDRFLHDQHIRAWLALAAGLAT